MGAPPDMAVSPLLVNEAQVAQVLTLDACFEPIAAALVDLHQGRAQVQPRRRMQAEGTRFQYIGGWASSAHLLGVKFSAHPSALPGRGTLVLFSTETGAMVASIAAQTLSRLRTAATTGLATRAMAREDASIAALIGTGRIARLQASAIAMVRPIKSVRVYGRDTERRVQFASELQESLGLPVHPAESAEAAVRGAHVVTTATTASEPVLDANWLSPGAHVNAIGSNYPDHREIGGDVLQTAEVIAVDAIESAREEAGDLIVPAASGEFDWGRVVGLGAILAGATPGRRTPDGVTVFKSVGVALQDLAVARLVLDALRSEPNDS